MKNNEKLLARNLEDILNHVKGLDSDVDKEGLQKQKLRLENQRYEVDTADRRRLARWAKWVVGIYLIIVFSILFINKTALPILNLSNTVLITLLGTTTLNILGLMYIVLKGYFNNKN